MRAVLALMLLSMGSFSVNAACTSPTGIAGTVRYDTYYKVLQYCTNTNWQNLGRSNAGGPSGSCAGPAGSEGTVYFNSNTNVLEYCNGSAWVNMGSSNPGASGSCTSPTGVRGSIFYNSATTKLEYCNGSTWINAANWIAPDSTPDAYTFNNLTGQATSTVVSSAIIQITGINIAVSVTATGASSQIQVCNDAACSSVATAWTTSANLTNGQYLQVRQTTSASGGALTTATINVGSGTTSWTATTSSCAAQGNTKVYLTTSGNWTVPASICTITVDCIGGGANGVGNSIVTGGVGGGGGAFSRKNSLTVTPGASIPYTVGGVGADTNFNSGSCLAKGASGQTGGQAASGAGDIKVSGGNGGSGGVDLSLKGKGCGGGGGGGGAGGPNGAGVAGSNGGDSDGTAGGVGGSGGRGDSTSGGTGGGANTAGNAGTEYSSSPTYGSGGGGGGGTGSVGASGGNNGASAGTYGAGGGGGGASKVSTSSGGAGAQGLIVITY